MNPENFFRIQGIFLLFYITICLIMYKKWSRDSFVTFLTGNISCIILNDFVFFPGLSKSFESINIISLRLIALGFFVFFLFRNLKKQNSLSILCNKNIYLCTIIVALIYLLFVVLAVNDCLDNSFLFSKFAENIKEINCNSDNLFLSNGLWKVIFILTLTPIFEELTGRFLLQNLLIKVNKPMRYFIFAYYGFCTAFLHYLKTLKTITLIYLTVSFTLLFFIRELLPERKQLWVCVLFHSLWQLYIFVFSFLF